MEKSPLQVQNLTLSYSTGKVFENLSLEFPSQKLCAIVGPNGAGKSTLLKASLDLIEKENGVAKFWDSPLKKVLKKVAYIAQRNSIDWNFPISVLDLVLMGLYVHMGIFKNINKADKELALNTLKMLDMETFAHRHIAQLSGGQQQRAFMARALIQNPDLYLMDEPFAGIDMQSEEKILTILKNEVSKGKTVVVVHHDIDTVKLHFEHLTLINKGVIAQGDIQSTLTKSNIQKTYGQVFQFENLNS